MNDRPGPFNEPEFYDAEEQKNIQQKKIDRLWEVQQQIRTCRQLISVDPDNKGVFVKMILQNGVVEEKYIDHPERAFARAVMMLQDLTHPEIVQDESCRADLKKIMSNQNFSEKDWWYYPKWRGVFRRIIQLLDEWYGFETPIRDEI